MSILAELAKLVIGAKMVKGAVDGLAGAISESREIGLVDGDRPKLTVHRVGSIEERAGHIKKMIQKGKLDPKVREWVAGVLNKKCGDTWCVAERDYRGEVKAIFDAVQDGVRYTGDIYNVDTYQHPRRTLEYKIEDCDGYVIMLGACLQSVGYPVKLHVIQTTKSPEWDHILLLVGLPPRDPTQWISLDGSVRKPMGWYPPKEMIAKTRSFTV